MANEISGTEGYATAGGVPVEGAEWSYDGDQAVIDRSNWTTGGEPLNAAGQRTGAISMSGPYSRTTNLAGKGVTRGALVQFRLGVTANLFIVVTGRVSKVGFKNNKDAGVDWNITASQYGPATLSL